jgi:hypothetical protein
MSFPESFYIALCMTVLLVGAIYWVWTQIQFVQRKVNMLENIVYELKTLCSSKPPEVMLGSLATPTVYPPAPSSVLGEDEDLLHEELHKDISEEAPIEAEVTTYPEVPDVHDLDVAEEEPLLDTSNINNFVKMVEVPATSEMEDLQPGGVGSGSVVASSLDNMSLKELRRLAQQRGIRGANELRKKELIQAIRALPVTDFDA